MDFKNSRFFFFLISIFCIIRLFNLEADPSVFKDTSDIHDEGWWASNAKNKVINDSWVAGEYAGGIAVAPLNSLITYGFLKVFGVTIFAVRLIPVLSSIGIIFLLFLLINKYDKKLALTSTLLLAVNHSFFMYSRIGQVEMLMLFFIMAMFYLLSFQQKMPLLLAGFCLGLALLTKFSTLAFTPVVLMFLLIQWYRQKISRVGIILFTAGAIIPLISCYSFVYYPHADLFHKQYDMTNQLIKDGWHTSLHSIITRLVFFPMSEYFVEPSIVLLLIFSGVFLIKINPLEKLSLKIKSIPEPVLLSAVWLFTYLIVLLFIDFSDRRFTSLVIPLCILSGYLINGRLNEQQTKTLRPSALAISFLLFLPLLGLHLNFHLKEQVSHFLDSKTTEGMNDEIINYLFIIYAIAFLMTAVILIRKYPKSHQLYSTTLFLSLLFFTSVLVMNSAIHLKNSGLLADKKILLFSITLLFALSVFHLLFKNKKLILNALLVLYFAFNLFAMTHDLFFSTHSIADTNRYLNDSLRINKNDFIIGHPVLFELISVPFKPLDNAVYDLNNSEIIKQQSKYKPSHYVTSLNGKEYTYHLREKEFVEENLPAKTELIKAFGWYPVNGIPRDSVYLYKIIYSN